MCALHICCLLLHYDLCISYLPYTTTCLFRIEFPKDLFLDGKALLLAAVFLIDFMYFEDNSGQQQMGNSRGGMGFGFS